MRKVFIRVAKLEPRMPALPRMENGFKNPVDQFVNAYFKDKNIAWPEPVDDRTYIRRIYLDIVGLLPPPEKVDAFITDHDPDKRNENGGRIASAQ